MAKTPHSRFLPALALCLLGCTALSSTAQAGWFGFGADKKDTASDKASRDAAAPAGDLDGSIRQAQLLRLSGNYPEAIRHLSQLMLVAADDNRVISEYGKTLAAMGHAQEAVSFLTRAQQLQAGDWSIYNALGVAYDEMDKQDDARTAYEHALTLKPGEPAVLNNYALSRMLAKDPDGARKLIARAEMAGGASDPKIARNIAMIKKLAPDAADTGYAANAPAAHVATAVAPAAPQARVVQAAPQARVVQTAPRVAVASQPMAAPQARVEQAAPQARVEQTAPVGLNIPSPSGAPRPLQAANSGVIQAQPQLLPQLQPRGVVMQRVPFDPLAGPVNSASHAPRALAAKPAPQTVTKAVAKAEAPAKAAAEDLQAKAEAIAKTLNGKPAAIAQAKAEANKPLPKMAEAPKAVAVKTAAKTKDAIPALRLSANAY